MSASTRWILIIVGLLVGNVAAMVILATVASATAPAVVPQYYDRAAHYDDAIDEAARSTALGWSATVRLTAASVAVEVRDATKAPLDGAVVKVTGYPRAHATRIIDVTLEATGHGTYVGGLPFTAVGVHDLTVVVERRGERFTMPATVDTGTK